MNEMMMTEDQADDFTNLLNYLKGRDDGGKGKPITFPLEFASINDVYTDIGWRLIQYGWYEDYEVVGNTSFGRDTDNIIKHPFEIALTEMGEDLFSIINL